jgi:hypothetical protein
MTDRVPTCRGQNYHVFCLGEARCSICGWDRYAFAEQTAAENADLLVRAEQRRSRKILAGVVERLGIRGTIRELAAIAAYQANELEHEPEPYEPKTAAKIGELMQIAESLEDLI